MHKLIEFYDEELKPKSSFPMKEPRKNAKKEESTIIKKTQTETYELNLTSMIDNGPSISVSPASMEVDSAKTSKKRKSNVVEIDMSKPKKSENESQRPLNDFESNTPYMDKYVETNNILRNSISKIEYGLMELQKDADTLRKSNHRKKYDYLTLIHGTMGTYIGNEIAAARELNNTITKCNDFEMKRYKELKLLSNEQDDDKAVLDSYRAFVNMPVGSYNYQPLGPSSRDLTINSGNINGYDVGSTTGYENYVKNMTPQQHMMALEGNPDINQVVIYEQRTGRRWFEVMNTRTGEVIQNADKMDMMLIDEFELDFNKKIARSINMGITMPLYVIEDPVLNEY